MMMYPAYTWTDSHPHHAYPKASEMNPPSHIPMYQPWSYPVPLPHGCCNHTYYYGGGPYSFQPHYPHYPPPPSFHPQGFYSPLPGAAYPVPPQHYSAELPRYEYDKKNHCCECHHRKDEKIKEESEVDNKKSESLVPLLLKDRPDYPIMWVPRGYTDSKAKEMEEKYSHNPPALTKHHEPPLKLGGSGEKVNDERFPFQIFWLPSKNDDVGKDTKENNLNLTADKGSSYVKEIKNECQGDEGEHKTNGSKHPVQKVIPVKQVATNDEKKSTKVVENSESFEKTDNASKASQKTSKLPPVCLRIDPLPRKKKTSRSPSPTEKRSLPIKDQESSQQQMQVLKKCQDEKVEGNTKTIDNKVERNIIADHGDIVPMGEGAGSSEKEKVEEKKILSEDAAALIIQAVYRGFEVRKSEPLVKLRQIYQVRKQAFELRNRIQDLESFGVDGKKEVIIGETIMSLLLKLDTIQGLHPFVREVRKSVAKELVGLQEKLDSLTVSAKSETPTTCGPQQVIMQPEEDVIHENSDQAQAPLDLLENHEPKATESKYDNAEAPNLEQQLEKSNSDEAIQVKFETDSESVIGENHKAEATESQEDVGESRPGSHKDECDQVPAECNEAHEVESTMSQGKKCTEPQLELTIEKLDVVPTECDEAMRLCKTHELEAIGLKKLCNTTIDEPEMELDKKKSDSECDNFNEVEGTVTNNGGLHPFVWEVRKSVAKELVGLQEKLDSPTVSAKSETPATESQEDVGESQLGLHKDECDQVPAECNEAHEVESTMSHGKKCHEPQLELPTEKLDEVPTECDEAMRLCEVEAQEGIGEASTECGEATGLCKTHGLEAMESKVGCDTTIVEPEMELDKKKSDESASECDNTNEVEGTVRNNGGVDDMELEHKKMLVQSDASIQEEAESGTKDEKVNYMDTELRKEVASTNELEELIRELRGRVKDLEKKLSKSKKIKVNKCSRKSRGCVVQKNIMSTKA